MYWYCYHTYNNLSFSSIHIASIAFFLVQLSLGENCQVDLGRLVSIITTSIPWIVNIYVVQLLLMYTFSVLGEPTRTR